MRFDMARFHEVLIKSEENKFVYLDNFSCFMIILRFARASIKIEAALPRMAAKSLQKEEY